MDKVQFGVLSTAKIGIEKVIPAMQKGKLTEITAISSRKKKRAEEAADKLDIDKTYGSYEELLEDPEIDAIYNPLPNHLHLPWSLKALDAGKHVLCEKPIGLSSDEATTLVQKSRSCPGLNVMEAFMYRFHPQWKKAKEMAHDGSIGRLQSISSIFSYFNDDPDNIRNIPEMGGGAVMDIGCYCLSLSRFIFDREPEYVRAVTKTDATFGTDWLASGVLDFGTGTSIFTCSTQLQPDQRVSIFGTRGSIEIEIPFNAPPDRHTRLWLTKDDERMEHQFEICDQYTLQGDAFARSILRDTPVPTPLSDAVHNMRLIEAVFESSEQGTRIPI
ncbi:MAG: Gfo/Idh/MocA family oxidoreductase [Balneolaceae bacterium]|nr:Gfo/Idh/MocA family oxidoreductase [Balneolaceae bacterium]